MKAWLLSAYRTDSHAWWADWLHNTFGGIDWQIRELPGRHFRWRIRGNPLSWLHDLPEPAPDIILASSMVDLATLKGLHPHLAGVPSLYYFHENQFAYPLGQHQVRSIEPQMVQLYGALAASRCLFNSRYNLESFLAGIDALLKKMPDAVPPGVTRQIRDKSRLLPVPVRTIAPGAKTGKLIVWNHRWEYDKAPERFAEAMLKLAARGVDFELALLGARPAQPPPALQRLRETLASHIVYDARADAAQYCNILGQAAIVVSTARHEFQGLAVMEAISAGATPLLPDSLCYPEQYNAQYLYETGNTTVLADTLTDWLQGSRPPPPDISAWLPQTLQPQWARWLQSD